MNAVTGLVGSGSTVSTTPPKRLSGLDASFLYTETPSLPMHTLKVAIVDPPEDEHGIDRFASLKTILRAKLHLLPAFQTRPVEVPLGLHHPVWVQDPEFHIDRHVFRDRIAAPGGPADMDAAIAKIAEQPLRRDRPLWEVWLLEGLADGGVVCVAKMHHSVADGVASAAMLSNVMTTSPQSRMSEPPEFIAEALPSSGTLLRDALAAYGPGALELPRLLGRTLQGGIRVLKHMRGRRGQVALPFRAPQTVFNRTLSTRRSFATASLPMSDLMEIKRALSVRFNDVVLAVVAGALDRFFEQRGESLQKSLTACVPMSVSSDAGELRRLQGNRVANLFTSLCNDIADPVARVRAIHAITQQSKEVQRRLGLATLVEWAEFAPPGPYRLLSRAYSATGLPDRLPPPANLIMSNVPGPAQGLFIAGARLRRFYSVGPLVEGIGLNVTAWSYDGRLNFACLADGEAVPALDLLTEGLPEALAILKRSAT
jgi:diacylglycerol O-acyltransferase